MAVTPVAEVLAAVRVKAWTPVLAAMVAMATSES
jgi:hypothetical protein